jgi:DNA-binding transcriptional LysR family regulator
MEDRLRKFARVVDNGSFSKAALGLHISQPALTSAVKKLERELGVVLLERQAKHLTMTSAGEKAYQAAKRLNIQVANLHQELTDLANLKPLIRLGLIDSVAAIMASEAQGFAALKQATDLSVIVNNSHQLTLATVKEQLEAAIIIGGTANTPSALEVTMLGKEPLVLVVNPADQDQYRRYLKAGRLPNFLSYNTGSHSQHLIQKALAGYGVRTEPSFYSTSPEVMFKMVLSRQGAAVLPFAMVKPQLSDGLLVGINPKSNTLNRPIYAIRLRHRLLPEVLEQTFSATRTALDRLTEEARQIS